MILSDSTAPARCSAFLPTRRRARDARSGCASSCAVSTACAGWSNAMSASASYPRRPRIGPPGPWRSRRWRLPTRGRCATCRSACATTRRCLPTRGNWWITCARRGGRSRETPALPRHQHPVIEIEDDGGMVAAVLLERKFPAGLIPGGNRAQAQRADVRVAWKLRLVQHLCPGEHRRTSEERRHVATAIDRRDVKRVREPVE